ncbi:unnamed protein product, partial [Ectocarpus sp. 12 AP-2014]
MFLQGLLSLAAFTVGSNAHVFLAKPVSRNFWETGAFQSTPSEYCPHCYQAGGHRGFASEAVISRGPTWRIIIRGDVAENGNYLEDQDTSLRHGISGDPSQTTPEGSNSYGLPNDNYPIIDECESGEVFQTNIVVSTWHYGHLGFFLCKTSDDETLTHECFNEYSLDRVESPDEPPIDPVHPGRYFLDPPCRESEADQSGVPPGAQGAQIVTATYKLPNGVTCDRCAIQMVYYTGNSCSHPGYGDF